MTLDTAALWAFINSPAGQYALMAMSALTMLGAGWLVRTNPQAHDYAQELYDLSIEVEPWVIEAEKVVPHGPERLKYVLDKYQAWAEQQGITGRRKRALKKHLPGLVEIAVKHVDPKTPPLTL